MSNKLAKFQSNQYNNCNVPKPVFICDLANLAIKADETGDVASLELVRNIMIDLINSGVIGEHSIAPGGNFSCKQLIDGLNESLGEHGASIRDYRHGLTHDNNHHPASVSDDLMMLLDKNIIKRNKEGNRNIDYIARITGNLSYMGYSDDESKVTLFDINEYISDVRDDIDDLSVPADKILCSHWRP